MTPTNPGYPITLTVYADPGHAWLRARVDLVLSMDVQPTSYSYRRGSWAYLEEDCDAGALLSALDAAGIRYQIRHTHTDNRSKIRTYPRWSTTP